jgi:hypothetical protein
VHCEHDLAKNGIEGAYGLAAGYLSAKVLEPFQKTLWQDVFHRLWKKACRKLAEGLKDVEIDAFTIVPCSRANVMDEMRLALLAQGLREVPGLIAKPNASISFAGKDKFYIANNVTLVTEFANLGEVKRLAMCDDFVETGRTLFGLHAALAPKLTLKNQVVLASPGISSRVA